MFEFLTLVLGLRFEESQYIANGDEIEVVLLADMLFQVDFVSRPAQLRRCCIYSYFSLWIRPIR